MYFPCTTSQNIFKPKNRLKNVKKKTYKVGEVEPVFQ